ncbi:unnamed protein product, partial [Trichogramma brassicae]
MDRSRINNGWLIRANPRGLRTSTLYLIHVRFFLNQRGINVQSSRNPCMIHVESAWMIHVDIHAIFFNWSCTLKQPDSKERLTRDASRSLRAWHPLWFQLCNHTSPGTQKLWFPGSCPPSHRRNFGGSLAGIVYEYDIHNATMNDSIQTAIPINREKTESTQGDALRTIKNIEVNADNLEVAWTALSRRYENKRLRISVYMKRLLYMPKAAKKSVAEITRLLDTSNECRRGLSALGEPVEHWDRWFVSLIVFNLDNNTRELWEQHLPDDGAPPTYKQLVKFLENKVQALDTANCPDPDTAARQNKTSREASQKPSRSVSAHHAASADSSSRRQVKCSLCSAHHRLGSCPDFLSYTIDQRWKYAHDKSLCYNCLNKSHRGSECPSAFKCRTCKQAHHTKLHRGQAKAEDTTSEQTPLSASANGEESLLAHAATLSGTTLLGTARVVVISPLGERMVIRALIDPAAEGSFVTEKVAQALSLTRTATPLTVNGLGGQTAVKAKSSVLLSLQSCTSPKLSIHVLAAVLTKLTSVLPKQRINGSQSSHLRGLDLADPAYETPAPIDCLIGAEMWPDIIQAGLRRGPSGSPAAYKTVFGWVITGPTTKPTAQQSTLDAFTITLTSTDALSNDLRKFWELEELTPAAGSSPTGDKCEEHFRSTHQRDESGRYYVRLPFTAKPELPGSYGIAKQRFLSLERSLLSDAHLRQQYCLFMREYETLGHMKRASTDRFDADAAYLPHHAVVGKKLRVVFNASQKVANNKSLNDFMHTGPKLQQEISTILLRWRLGQYAFTADIVKMYRQIYVREEDVTWQRILWRCNPKDPVQEFDLTTVTYGTACAPYLALRVINQLADDEATNFTVRSKILKENMYVDDALVSCDSVDAALHAKRDLIEILRSAGMQLDKWAANCPDILSENHCASPEDRAFDKDLIVPTLGLRWTPSTDEFSYTVPELSAITIVTKRAILSEVARIYDPTGWLTPVTVRAKMLLQHLWLQGHDWDQPTDNTTTELWLDFRRKLEALQTCRIPRWLGVNSKSSRMLHGFSDASERAYAASIYLVSQDALHLLTAKSTVAPIRSVSVPRLELCGATLLARLMKKVLQDINLTIASVHCWTDSQIVLAWLRAPPCTWKVFVANRVSEIHSLLPNAAWGHVASKHNPADVASRGCSPDQLQKDDTIENILARLSSLNRLYRVVAYCLRWKNRLASTKAQFASTTITAKEITAARITITRAVQVYHFREEVHRLHKGDDHYRSARLRRHHPYLDDEDLLQVGGRLTNSLLPYNERHPLVIPKTSHLARLLVLHAHEVTLHGGPQLVQSFLRRQWWILQAGSLIRQVIHSCVTCTRYQGRRLEQFMAPLPEPRVTPSRPFTVTGVDYAGPLALRTSKRRGQKSFKGYVAIFVCFATRAVHLEVVSDYSTKTFLMALRRFFARRGLSRTMYSDCGTTFQGAANELHHLFNLSSAFMQEIMTSLAQDEVQWKFIPPRAPHFGGLWEAAVKAFKSHLKRVVGAATLTFEEFSTLIAKIEACLNSRPLCPLSSDPQDMAALTPGHFLIGSSLLSAPEPFTKEGIEGLPRWRHTIQMKNHFWRRWQREVLQHMQLRQKWLKRMPALQPGDLVLLTDDLQPPQRWPLARIDMVHPGTDGLPRVVTLRTPTTTLTRPIAKLVRLPIGQVIQKECSSSEDQIEELNRQKKLLLQKSQKSDAGASTILRGPDAKAQTAPNAVLRCGCCCVSDIWQRSARASPLASLCQVEGPNPNSTMSMSCPLARKHLQ